MGTEEFRPVEMVAESNDICPYKAEIYTIGMAVYSLHTGFFPFSEPRNRDNAVAANDMLINKIKSDLRSVTNPAVNAGRIVLSCIQTSPLNRGTLEQLLADPYFATAPDALEEEDIKAIQ